MILLLTFIIGLEQFYKQPLDTWFNQIIVKWQEDMMEQPQKAITYLHYISYLGNGNELLFWFLYHLIISGKYHQAFQTTILISMSFTVITVCQVIYQDPRPYWIESPFAQQIRGYDLQFSFGNPSCHAVTATINAFIILRKKRTYLRILASIVWIVLQSWCPLVLGLNSFTQTLFGV